MIRVDIGSLPSPPSPVWSGRVREQIQRVGVHGAKRSPYKEMEENIHEGKQFIRQGLGRRGLTGTRLERKGLCSFI